MLIELQLWHVIVFPKFFLNILGKFITV
jgi:hypothetical protein